MLGPVAAWEHPSSSHCQPGAAACVSGQKHPPDVGLAWAEVLSAANVAPVGSYLQSRTEPGGALKAFQPFQPFPVSLGCRKA